MQVPTTNEAYIEMHEAKTETTQSKPSITIITDTHIRDNSKVPMSPNTNPALKDVIENASEKIAGNSDTQQAIVLPIQREKHIANTKKRRRSKAERENLLAAIFKILEAGFTPSSLTKILGVRKDYIGGLLLDGACSSKIARFPQYKHIISRDAKLEQIPWITAEASDWEAIRCEDGTIILKPANLDEICVSLRI